MNAIDVNRINKFYGDGKKQQQVLFDVSFTVQEGEAYGFIGANGAGKSTSIKAILDVIRPASGSINLFGTDSRAKGARNGVAFLPENAKLAESLTPLETVKLGVMQHDVNVADMNKHCMYWLERFRVDHAANKLIRKLSKGMAQRTALAQCMACQPKLLILDEPLSGLDPIGRREVVDIFAEYHRSGGTLFFTSHVLHDVERLAERYALIDKGRIKAVQSRDAMTHEAAEFIIEVASESGLQGYRQDSDDRFAKVVSYEQLFTELNQVERANCRLLSVKPSLDLEKSFFAEVKTPV